MYTGGKMFNKIGFDPHHQIKILCNQYQTIRLLNNEKPHFSLSPSMFIFISIGFDEVQLGNTAVRWMETAKMPADG